MTLKTTFDEAFVVCCALWIVLLGVLKTAAPFFCRFNEQTLLCNSREQKVILLQEPMLIRQTHRLLLNLRNIQRIDAECIVSENHQMTESHRV